MYESYLYLIIFLQQNMIMMINKQYARYFPNQQRKKIYKLIICEMYNLKKYNNITHISILS